MSESGDRLLTPEEVADLFRVDPKTLARWASRAGFPKAGRREATVGTDGLTSGLNWRRMGLGPMDALAVPLVATRANRR